MNRYHQVQMQISGLKYKKISNGGVIGLVDFSFPTLAGLKP